MDARLVCKIVTHTASGGTYRGSGYPITPNRIITAAHVVDDAAPAEGHDPEANVRCIELAFGGDDGVVQAPVAIEWNGTAVGVDVAVLSCALPAELQPGHELLTEPPNKPIEWCARGYTEFGKANREGGKDAYYGKLIPFADNESTVALSCHDGPVLSQQWAGGSGSVAFDAATAPKAVAVVTDYQGGRKQDQLVAVPMLYLLGSDLTRDDFRRAIQFEAYQRRKTYCDNIVGIIAATLCRLDNAHLKQVAKQISGLPGVGVQEIDIEKSSDSLSGQIARCVVSHRGVTRVVGCLVGLMQDIGRDNSGKLAEIIDHLLPLNYAPEVIHRLHEQVSEHRFGLVENEVFSRTLAEIIMAGYDQERAKFIPSTASGAGVRGRTAIDYSAGPEVGPHHPGSEQIHLLQAASDFLYDLLALKDEVLGFQDALPQRYTDGAPSVEALTREIKAYAIELESVLTSVEQGIHPGRSVYCLLTLPQEQTQRDFRKCVLSEVCKHVPKLVFVELIPRQQAKPDEHVVYNFINNIQARLVRT